MSVRVAGQPSARPSRRHQLVATVLPRLRRARELDTWDGEAERLRTWHAGLQRDTLPTGAVPFFARRFSLVREDLPAGFPSYTLTPRGTTPTRTVVYLHGGGFVAPTDPFHVRYAARLARALGARVVLPDYPLAPEHTWRDSHEALVALAERHLADGPVVLAGDSAGGNVALAVALTLRDRARRDGGPQPSHLLLVSPWVDLTESTPDTEVVAARDPWLMITKLRAYAHWWAGSEDDLARPEVSPALGDLTGLPPTLMFFGTRDLLWPGGRLLVERARAAGWDLTSVEAPDRLHVYPLLPTVPEARRAFRTTREFLR